MEAKKLILAAFALTTAASVFAQGTVVFNIRLAANQVHVWGPSSTNPWGLGLIALSIILPILWFRRRGWL